MNNCLTVRLKADAVRCMDEYMKLAWRTQPSAISLMTRRGGHSHSPTGAGPGMSGPPSETELREPVEL